MSSTESRSTFQRRNGYGEEISYCEYYRARYDININDMQQTLLVYKDRSLDIAEQVKMKLFI